MAIRDPDLNPFFEPPYADPHVRWCGGAVSDDVPTRLSIGHLGGIVYSAAKKTLEADYSNENIPAAQPQPHDCKKNWNHGHWKSSNEHECGCENCEHNEGPNKLREANAILQTPCRSVYENFSRSEREQYIPVGDETEKPSCKRNAIRQLDHVLRVDPASELAKTPGNALASICTSKLIEPLYIVDNV